MQTDDNSTILLIVLDIILPIGIAAVQTLKPKGRKIDGLTMICGLVACLVFYLIWRQPLWPIVGAVGVLLAWKYAPHLRKIIEMCRATRSLGILRVEKTILDEGTDTGKIIDSAQTQIDVVAFAASKFVDRHDALKIVAREGRGCRLILVDPASEAVSKLSSRWGYEENMLARIIRRNLCNLNYLRQRGWQIAVRFAPCDLLRFRLVIVDRKTIYITYYRPGTRGLDLPQVVLDASTTEGHSFGGELLELFDDIWGCAQEVDWSRFTPEEPVRQPLA